ncbi:DUF3079 domain-containing protein [Rhodoferax sp. PAMC 29310]|uniref:DUF3079 domain-containing protein n=1 Tax=Rhodoferax sp. PAMC 29310 TaxID=2822760 RepID=UPI001B33C729|nr:DUF3079 domain-containing protein [Rhodoferax sp. PAMC 29310]
MAKKVPNLPTHHERVCWGCDRHCAASDMRCGNGADRAPHPVELFGDDCWEWGDNQSSEEPDAAADSLEKSSSSA